MPTKIPLNIEEYKKEASKECFICNIAKKGKKYHSHSILYEDDKVIVFLNQYPTQIGQTLVCPKEHLTEIDKMDTAEYSHLMNICQKTAAAVKTATNAQRVYIASLGSNQVNSHIHIHILPISDNLPYEQQQLTAFSHEEGIWKYTDDELVELIQKIKANF